MDNLGLFDQFFYKAEQYNVLSAVMGGASILEPANADEPLEAEAIAGHLASRLQDIALLRTKFVQDPLLLGTVKKIEDPNFDIRDHITVETLPAPGGYAQLSQRLAEISATPLALSDMWRWIVIGGLEDGKLAVMCNIHHAVADGMGMVEALSSTYDAGPVAPELADPGVRVVEEPPAPLQLLRHALLETGERLWINTPRFLLKNTGPILAALGKGVRERLSADAGTDDVTTPDVGLTSLNINTYSDRRTLSWKTLPLSQVKQLARHFGVTVNDVGLILYSYAMEYYFQHRGENVDFDLWCGMPVSTRASGSAAGGNQVTAGRICLHNSIADPRRRLAAIHADAEKIKEFMRPEEPVVDTAELAALVFPIAIDAMLILTEKLNLLGRLGGSMAFVNALFSNVPGPHQAIYVANGRMAESIPMIPAVDILAVSGGMTSVDQNITIGFHCDAAVIDDPEIFVRGVDRGLELLAEAASGTTSTGAKAKPKTRPKAKARPKANNKRKAGAADKSRKAGAVST